MTHSNSKSLWISSLLFLLALSNFSAFAQAVPDVTVAAAIGNLGSRAAVVFDGQVVAIRHLDGVVEIDFQVDRNVKAANVGSYTLREWSGLWAAGQRRYWIGERAVVFLNGSSKNGFSSSVDGMEGILPILPDAKSTLVVDVQRLRTRVLRAAGAPMVDSATQMSLAQVTAAVDPRCVSIPIAPASYPPVKTPVARPIYTPIENPNVTTFPNPALAPAQNSVVLVMNPDQTDDFLSTDDDAEPAHKKSESPDAAH